MRGKQPFAICARFRVRITPAHAGKTKDHIHNVHNPEDHPRSCGENVVPVFQVATGVGSPPLMRGKRHKPELQRRPAGITPAHAGKTPFAYCH